MTPHHFDLCAQKKQKQRSQVLSSCLYIFYMMPLGLLGCSNEAATKENHTERTEHKQHQEHEKHEEDEKHDEHEEQDKHEEHEKHEKREEHQGHEGTRVKIAADMKRDLRITTQKATAQNTEAITAFGNVHYIEDGTQEITAPINGKIEKVYVSVGDFVKAGDLVLSIKNSDVALWKSQLQNLQEQYSIAKNKYEQIEQLFVKQAASIQEKQEAEKNLKQIENDVKSLQTQIGFLQNQSSQVSKKQQASKQQTNAQAGVLLVRANQAGTVLSRNAVMGRSVDQHDTLLVLADKKSAAVTIHVFERDVVRLKKGNNAVVTLTAFPAKQWSAVVDKIDEVIDPNTHTAAVRLRLTESIHTATRAGMSATAQIFLEELEEAKQANKIITVAANAVQKCGNQWCVFIPVDPETFIATPVGRGRDVGDAVEILSGLSNDQEVVVDGAFILKAQLDKQSGAVEEHHH